MRVRRRVRQVPLMLCVMILTSFFQVGQSVWSLSIPHQVYIVGTVSHFCNGMDLTPRQSTWCEENRELMASIRYGANLAVKQCQYQFQYRQWNCSVPERDSNTLFRRITGKGTKEAAFTYAISSAGVVYSIARSCVEGNLSACGCSRERRPKDLKSEFQWGGCGDNIEEGVRFTKQFMIAGEDNKAKETRKQERTLMNLHNNEVGIQVVKEKSNIICKCHGMSGSCNMKTCQRELPEFRVIGDALHMKYDNAVRVKMQMKDALNILNIVKKKRNGEYRRDNGGKLRSTHKKASINTMVYLKDSPDYCFKTHDFPGTQGRICSTDAFVANSCTELCCGRGYRSIQVVTRQRCKCKFHWCCEIRCKECENEETKNMCR
ncbi:Protein Wnt-5b [Desmophyllum pertusum]|uniref:Protein Wnt n=1 Tax=Desmophyllum pertusum TaxID=174260 RepID=A0A9X0A407_9CNID|nr:Protein Wnt-5b [Desmophyllum pertusum]